MWDANTEQTNSLAFLDQRILHLNYYMLEQLNYRHIPIRNLFYPIPVSDYYNSLYYVTSRNEKPLQLETQSMWNSLTIEYLPSVCHATRTALQMTERSEGMFNHTPIIMRNQEKPIYQVRSILNP